LLEKQGRFKTGLLHPPLPPTSTRPILVVNTKLRTMSRSLPASASKICFPGSPLYALVQARARNNRIIITFTNYGFVDLAENLLASFALQQITNYVMVALDAKTQAHFQAKGEPTYLLELEKKLFTEDSHNFGTAGFVDICNVKPWLVLEILKGGFDVVWTDTDIVWLHVRIILEDSIESDSGAPGCTTLL